MATKDQLDSFLQDFKAKMKVFDIVICISFHLMERPLSYPLKDNQS